MQSDTQMVFLLYYLESSMKKRWYSLELAISIEKALAPIFEGSSLTLLASNSLTLKEAEEMIDVI